MGPQGSSIFFSHTILNVRSYRNCHPGRGPVPELPRRRFLLRQRHRMDGRCPLDHLPGGACGEERWPVLRAVGAVHDPAGHRRVHGGQDPDQERRDQGARPAHLRSDPLNRRWSCGRESFIDENRT